MATVTKRGDSYKITVSCGYNLEGKQIRRHTTWKPEPGMTARQIKKELDRQTVLFEERCRSGQVLDGNVTLADFIERWFQDYAEQQLRPTTIAGYRKLLKRTLPAIGHIRLSKLQPHHLMKFYANLAEPGIREKGEPAMFALSCHSYAGKEFNRCRLCAGNRPYTESNIFDCQPARRFRTDRTKNCGCFGSACKGDIPACSGR